MRLFIVFILFISTIFLSCKKIAIDPVDGTQLAEFNEAPHNAFTDLIKYNGNYYCVFREGSTHDSWDGKLRVVESPDGDNWTKLALLSIDGKDLRDPHFFVDNRNVLSIATSAKNAQNIRTNLFFKLRNNEFVQSNTAQIDNDYWLWSFSKLKDSVYSIGYNLDQICFSSLNSTKPKICLFNNTDTDCINYKNASPRNWINNSFKCPCEASTVFLNDSTLVAIVRDEHTPGLSHIGVSEKPFEKWKWQTFTHFVRGPKLALLPDGRIFLAAASMAAYDKTYCAILSPDDFSVQTIRAFPSGGDTGYPGVIIEGNTALISYYSSHEGNARVYIERINY